VFSKNWIANNWTANAAPSNHRRRVIRIRLKVLADSSLTPIAKAHAPETWVDSLENVCRTAAARAQAPTMKFGIREANRHLTIFLLRNYDAMAAKIHA
jgi:hypothetical protein